MGPSWGEPAFPPPATLPPPLSHPLATRATRPTSKAGDQHHQALRPAKAAEVTPGHGGHPHPRQGTDAGVGALALAGAGEGSRREALRLREAVLAPRRPHMLTARPRSLGAAQAHWFTVRMLPGSWRQVSSKWRKRSWADVGWRAEGCRWPGGDFGIWSASRGRGLRSAPEETPGALTARTHLATPFLAWEVDNSGAGASPPPRRLPCSLSL